MHRHHHHQQQQQLNHSFPLQLHCRASQYLKRDRRQAPVVAESNAAGFKQRRPPRAGFLLTTDAYSYVVAGGRRRQQNGSWTGPVRPGNEGQGKACVGGRKNGSTWKPVDVQQRETMTETWFRRRRRRRRIISPRQYCLSFTFYSPVVKHVRPSFL